MLSSWISAAENGSKNFEWYSQKIPIQLLNPEKSKFTEWPDIAQIPFMLLMSCRISSKHSACIVTSALKKLARLQSAARQMQL